MNIQSPLFKTIAQLLIAVMWAQPLHSIAANLQVDHKGGGNTHVSAAGNGVPLVNIATPSKKGLSHNRFTDYNVDRQGLILNNSTDKLTQTQLGGIIVGNSQLNGKAASTILNEVTGGQRSQLKGYTEVAGQQAHVIVANPHGITCDGCGFINTPQVTLSTGRPMIEQGRLQGYDVDSGDIEIAGAGLNASNISRFDLITRSAKINAELHANELNIITGRNQAEAGTLKVTAKTGTASDQPLLAIDSSALGGMYAGAIRLVGTEVGVGVKLAGDMAASSGDVQIDANGQLTLARVSAAHDLHINTAQDVELTRQVHAGNDMAVTATALNNQDGLLARRAITISADQVHNTGVIEAGINADGSLNAQGSVRVQSAELTNSGSMVASRELSIKAAGKLDNRSGQLISDRALKLETGQLDNRKGLVIAGGDIDVTVAQLDNHSGKLIGQQQLTVMAGHVDNSGGELSAGQLLTLDAQSVRQAQGQLLSGGTMNLDVAHLDNSDKGLISAGDDAQLRVDRLDNQNQGTVISDGALSVQASQLNNHNQGLLASKGVLRIKAAQLDQHNQGELIGEQALHLDLAGGDLDNSQGGLIYAPELHLQGIAALDNSRGGEISTPADLTLNAVQLDNSGGLISSGQNLRVRIDGLLRNSLQGLLTAARDLKVEAGMIDNRQQGALIGRDNVAVHARVLDNRQQGEILAGQQLEITADDLDNSEEGLIHAAGELALHSLGHVKNGESGEISSQNALQLTLNTLDNTQGGVIVSSEQLKVAAHALDNSDQGLLSGYTGLSVLTNYLNNQKQGTLSSREGELRIQVTEHLDNSQQGALVSQQALDVQADSMNNRQGIVSSAADVSLQLDGLLDNDGGQIFGENILVTAAQLDNTAGDISADQTLTLTGLAQFWNRQGGQVLSGSALLLQADMIDNRESILASEGWLSLIAGQLSNSLQGRIAANQQLKMQAQQVDNHSQGRIYSQQAGVELKAGTLSNHEGLIQARTDLNLEVAGRASNRGGQLLSEQGAVSLRAESLDNRSGILTSMLGRLKTVVRGVFSNQSGTVQGHRVELLAGELANQQGHVAATTGDLDLFVATLNNQGGGLYAQQQLKLTGHELDNSSHGQIAGQSIDFGLSGALNNSSGLIEADTLQLSSTRLNNRDGRLRALATTGHSLIISAADLDNRNGLIEIGNQDFTLDVPGLLNQSGQILHAGSGQFDLFGGQARPAGGSITSRGQVTLTGDQWENSTRFEAAFLTLNVGRFTQTGNGQLIASRSLTATGDSWINHGLIASDGDLSLNLGSSYSGNGQLVSLGDLKLVAPQLSLDAQGLVYGAGHTRLQGQQLINQGVISPAGNLQIEVQKLTNRGTLGSAGALGIKAADVLNEQGLIFSGADMQLSVDRLSNRYADIYSLGNIDLRGHGNSLQARRVENISASMEALGDFILHSALTENRRDVLDIRESGKYSVVISELPCHGPYRLGDCDLGSNGRRNAAWQVTEREKLEVVASSAASRLQAGGNLNVYGQSLLNSSSQIGSGKDLLLSVEELINQGVKPAEITTQRVFISGRKPTYYHYLDLANSFNAKHVPRVQPGSVEQDLSRFVSSMEREYLPGRQTIETPLAGEEYSAIIQAAGAVTIEAQQHLDNSVIRAGYRYIGGGNRVDVQQPGSTQGTDVQIHAQLPPDLQQKQIDPVALPNFSLPVGDKGLFRLSDQRAGGQLVSGGSDSLQLGQGASRAEQMVGQDTFLPGQHAPGNSSYIHGLTERMLAELEFLQGQKTSHNYLIETNPALTQMRQFLSSDYLLGGLGLSPDNMQKRLGDGLYEQKLMRDALIARTGQRYIAGLNSDEAMFRYLMDNAIASKDALNLSVGISLTAEQVAALTHDIVWLEQREVLGEQVLVPVLYMAQAEGRLAPNGALIQGQDLALISGGDLSNQGTLRASNSLGVLAQNIQNSGLMQAGERLSLLAEGSISNRQAGILAGRDVDLTTRTGDILNERSITRHESALGNSRWETSFADSAARIEAANSLSLNAGRDVQNLGGVLQSGGDLQISAGRDVSLTSAEERHGISRGSHYLNSQTAQLISETVAGGALAIDAGRDLTVVASRIESGQDMQLIAGNDLTLAAAANESHHYSKSKKRTSQRDLVQQQGTEVVSGGQFVAVAGNDLALISSSVTASNEAYLVAGGKVQLLAEQDVDYSFSEKKKKGSFGRKSYKSDERTQVTHVGSSITSGGDLVIISGDGQRYQAAQLTSGADLILDSGADIEFEGVKDLEQKSRIRSKNSWVWQSAKGKGHTDETLIQSQLQAQGEIAIRAAERIQIDIKEINQHSINQTIDAMVQAEPQLAWLKDMQQRGDVDWRQVKELHDSFSYSSSGLSGPAAMVASIVVAYFAAGAASGAIGTAAGAGAGSGSAMAAAGTATASAVASGAAVGSTVAAGWANATLSGILAGAAGGAAGAASQGRDWRNAALSGAITGGFAGYLSAGTYYNNPINTAGKITEYVGSGEWMSLSKEVSRLGMNQAFGYVQSKAVKEVGLKPEELNWALMAGSIAGNQLKSVGSRLSESNEDFYKSNNYGIRGVLNREAKGLPFDAIDIALGYQGLPDATVQDYLSKLGLDNDLSSGHSLGTLTNIYLGSNGLAEKVYLYSVPFGAVAPNNAEVMIGSWDLVNGGWAGKLFNWDAEVVPLKPWEHGFEYYKQYIKN